MIFFTVEYPSFEGSPDAPMMAIPAGENILFMPVTISSEEYIVSAIFFGSPRAMRASTTIAPAADAMTGFISTSRISG